MMLWEISVCVGFLSPPPDCRRLHLQITVQCLDMVESPLINLPVGEAQASPLMERFRQAQRLSTEAASVANTSKYRDLVHPLPRLKQKNALDALWAKIDQVIVGTITF